MNLLIPIFVVTLLCASGIFLGLRAYNEDKSMTVRSDEVSPKQIAKIAAYYGASTSLVFFGLLLFGGIWDGDLTWSIERISRSILVSIVLGIVVVLGSVYQIHVTGRYKEGLRAYLKKKSKLK